VEKERKKERTEKEDQLANIKTTSNPPSWGNVGKAWRNRGKHGETGTARGRRLSGRLAILTCASGSKKGLNDAVHRGQSGAE
jgi:hypothetical protein